MLHRLSLHHLLFLCFTVLIAVPAVALIIWLRTVDYRAEIDGAHDKHLLVAQNMTRAISRYVRDTESAFQLTARIINDRQATDALTPLFAEIHMRFVAVIDADGKIEQFVPAVTENINSDLVSRLANSTQPYMEQARQKPGQVIFTDAETNEKNQPVILLLLAMPNERFLVGELAPDYLIDMQQNIAFGVGGHAAIVDKSGQVLAHPNSQWRQSRRNISKVEPVRRMMAGEIGVSQFYSPAKKEDMIAGFATVPRTGWGVMVPQPIAELNRVARDNLIGQIIIIILAVLFASLVSWWLARFLAAPIQSVVGAAKRYESERIVEPVPAMSRSTPQELQQLAQAFNSLADEVNHYHQSLENEVADRTIALREEVLERKKIENRLRDQQAQMAHITRLNSVGEMASGFAHEINQPLAAICAYVDGSLARIERGEEMSPEIVGALRKASHQASRAGDVIRRIRNFVRYGDSKRTEINLNQTLDEVAEMLRNEARIDGIEIEISVCDSELTVFADYIQLQQVILNLGRNGLEAMQFSAEADRKLIIEAAVNAEGFVVIAVSDHGSGIPTELRDKIFEPFYTTKKDGLGMGLPICQTIAEVHEGHLRFESSPEAGTRFDFCLPVHSEALKENLRTDSRPNV